MGHYPYQLQQSFSRCRLPSIAFLSYVSNALELKLVYTSFLASLILFISYTSFVSSINCCFRIWIPHFGHLKSNASLIYRLTHFSQLEFTKTSSCYKQCSQGANQNLVFSRSDMLLLLQLSHTITDCMIIV